MKDVGLKPDTQRSAYARGELRAPADCIRRVAERNTEKGDPQESARLAGIMVAKRTDTILPLAHSLPIHAADVHFETLETRIAIEAEVHTIGPTGVEMEALTAVSVAALTLYDMLKPYAEPEELTIGDTHLVDKRGGKSDHARQLSAPMPATVLMVSNPIYNGDKADTAGQLVVDDLTDAGLAPIDYRLLPDDAGQITDAVRDAVDNGSGLVATVGGTGIGPKDQTIEAVKPLLTTPMPGLMEAARAFGQRRSPSAAISRGVAGLINDTLVVTLPGSRGGANESVAALRASLVHTLETRRRFRADAGHNTQAY
ncbi:bifunctional molybdenum cofactor biosynthesis protein MoaC/MoaB [Salinisphaera sp. USBA-960]|uniref:bifunctional molybdenum cofactor biosynthesis protein MoaC/MoaB n=1 Tax=Salinisphaera orenii TaxID=856731 RepID=UPI000DBE84C5|nr:bifunctional molybdenum cofactor biosynthesis protein MoaC/MoaB [Salifodinibacter halophilus]NNC26476.1 bifunctional molybdenum cofactor biosynthesis protein MoaC/MoaB [Salifodinibacter halophilus]